MWDSLRGIYLVLTPEEWVRQHLIACLITQCGAQPTRNRAGVCRAAQRPASAGRCGGVDDAARPLLVAECKAPHVKIDGRTFAQAVRYNSVLGARYVVLTNGLQHYCCEFCDGQYRRLDRFPDLRR